MPGQTPPRRRPGLARTPRQGLPEPGIGGYDYPRGPYGATGFPGSTPASPRTHSQGPDGRDDQSYLGVPKDTISGYQEQWATVPVRRSPAPTYRGGNPQLVRNDLTAQQPKSPWAPTPGVGPADNGRAAGWDFPARIKKWTTGPEHRMTPVIGGPDTPGSQNVRNEIAQRYKAVPGMFRAYRPSPNPAKTGAQLNAPSRRHPGTFVHGHPDGKPVPGMDPQPGPPYVVVCSRYVSLEGGQEDYAMDRPMLFTKGGTPPEIPHGSAPHIRGARMSGLRYFGDLTDQQRIGLRSDSYGIVRARGPRHRPTRFETPAPHTANYYDIPADYGTQAPDMIHRSPVRAGNRAKTDTGTRAPSAAGPSRQTGRRPRRG